jgi:hypothetical protein
MSYLTSYAIRRALAPGTVSNGPRIDEEIRLNLPGYHGDAHIRVLVEDTSGRRWRRRPPEPTIRLRITDCSNAIHLQFAVSSAEQRKNSLHKADTLLRALQAFRDALEAECELHERRCLDRG